MRVDAKVVASDHFHLRAALSRLVDATERYITTTDDPGLRSAGTAIEEALDGAKAVLDATKHEERCEEDRR